MSASPVAFARRVALVTLVIAPLAALVARSQPGAPAPSASPPGNASAAAGKCGVCHPSERVQFETSLHAREQVHCTACHGGNDASLEMSVAHSSGFRGRPARKDVPALCASCHANEARMRAYNLPVDQYALYQTSGHGKRLAAGDTRVAVCSDCHGAHAILAPSDPGSSTFPTNIPKTCGRCHGDARLMPAGKAVFADYSKSVHAAALLDKGNLKAPTCVSCHGVHGAAPPAVGDIDKVCGQCHTAERRYFTAGAHRHPGSGEGPECSSCHGAHAIEAARPERIATSCAGCHAKGSPEAALGSRMWTEVRGAADEIDKATAIATRADAVPINTDDYRARLEEARTYLREAMPAAHSVQEEVVAGLTTRARSVAHEVESDIHGKLGNLHVRRFVLILFWFYLLLTILVLRRFQKRAPRI
jgi:predicted CXXCH cytochrome family protein